MQGKLSQVRFPSILHSLNRRHESGILHLSRERIAKRIFFGNGTVIFASSDHPEDRLGELLVRQGRMTRTHLELASERVRRTGRKLGQALVEMGLMSPGEVQARVEEQIQTIVFSMFTWDRGEYLFRQQEDPIAQDVALHLPTVSIILEGIRRIRDANVIRSALGDPSRLVSYSRDPWLHSQNVALTPEESFVLSRVDGQSSVSDILLVSPLGEDATLRCLYALISAGFLEFGGKSRDLAPSRRPAFGTVLETSGASRRAPASAGAAQGSPEEQWVREEIEGKHAALCSGTYYDWLEVRRTATPEEIKKAYFRLIKKYHPDRHRSPSLAPLRGSLEEICSKLTDAYKQVSDDVGRRRYDGSLRTESPRGEDLTPRAAGPIDATSEKRLAERRFQEAKKRMARKDLHGAISLLAEAVRLDEAQPTYHKLLARTLATNPAWWKRAEEHFQTAVRLDPFDLECWIGLGAIYESAGLNVRAKRMYAKALEIDPQNEELKRKLRRL